jgi:hypothetical protein
MALAMRFDDLIRSGEVTDYAELARLGHVSRARLSQIASLLGLAPDIQEEILFLPRTLKGRDPIQLRHLLLIAAIPDWLKQRSRWKSLTAGRTPSPFSGTQELSSPVPINNVKTLSDHRACTSDHFTRAN